MHVYVLTWYCRSTRFDLVDLVHFILGNFYMKCKDSKFVLKLPWIDH